ncbi:hypothetical protein GOP47_0009273 [Adiantum capillus-veneris]|uniref:Uncharacterized protein n=1 Tax=Adiantum capillus-veneris TaxID=13818 RepID=A0A9D4UWS3_ADICA|nr:hypothetical protein GOP47_0009273 [Adiantum capillus-veneris]
MYFDPCINNKLDAKAFLILQCYGSPFWRAFWDPPPLLGLSILAHFHVPRPRGLRADERPPVWEGPLVERGIEYSIGAAARERPLVALRWVGHVAGCESVLQTRRGLRSKGMHKQSLTNHWVRCRYTETGETPSPRPRARAPGHQSSRLHSGGQCLHPAGSPLAMGLPKCGGHELFHHCTGAGLSGVHPAGLPLSWGCFLIPLVAPWIGLHSSYRCKSGQPTVSAVAFHVVKRLRLLAKSGRTVLISIHQLGSEVFELFHHLCLLSSSQTVYFGERLKAQEFFDDAGFSCPPFRNPSDHFLWVINFDFEETKDEELEGGDYNDTTSTVKGGGYKNTKSKTKGRRVNREK